MSKKKFTRREFIITSTGAVITLAVKTPALTSPYDPKGLPTRPLGKTGVQVPYIGLGTGKRYCSVSDEETGLAILNHALDNGLYYWDTASIYKSNDGKVISEERLGKVLKTRREEVFLATKVRSRNIDDAKAELEQSLKRLQTDQIDLYQIHMVTDMNDVEELFKPKGLVRFVDDLKSQGVVRFIGFTGHTSAEALKTMAERHNFDTILFSLNHHRRNNKERREEDAMSAAYKKQMGIIAMKVIRPRETVKSVSSTELIHYALSLPGMSSALLGQESIEIINANLEVIRNFKPLSKDEMERIRFALNPFYKNKHLEWMHPHYIDGMYT
jgi:aryl-alcohol dehydrogenase-like predicted oxidoreductase